MMTSPRVQALLALVSSGLVACAAGHVQTPRARQDPPQAHAPDAAAPPSSPPPLPFADVPRLGPLPPTDTLGKAGVDDLVVVDRGKSSALVVLSPRASAKERLAAQDLVEAVEKMSGVKLAIADTEPAVKAALSERGPLIVIGEQALALEPSLRKRLAAVVKPNAILAADAIVAVRKANRVFLAGNNDDAHGYAVVYALQQWGCRWFMPTAFGESIPEQPTLKVGALDYAYGAPLEVRGYWISWNSSRDGKEEFTRRNFFNHRSVSGGHALDEYVKALVPPGKTTFNVPIAEDATATHVAKQVAPLFAAGKDFSLGMDDGMYELTGERDLELRANLRDKYFRTHTLTDNFMEFYNSVSAKLLRQHPNSKSHIGFLAYSNITLPPQRQIVAAKPLVMSLAAIDVDPNHSMDDPRSPTRREYREMVARWAKVMEGRVFIYDYDQSMLVCRDVPNPIIQAFRHDVKHYVAAGTLGIDTESRGATATIFNNLYLRGQLMWNPDLDVDGMLRDFYLRFYGPAAEPMAEYWSSLIAAWERSVVTEHEFFALPAIYTPAVVAKLGGLLQDAERRMREAATSPTKSRAFAKYEEHMRFTRLSYDVLDGYMAMVAKGAGEGDYVGSVVAGTRGLAARAELTKMNPTFTALAMGEEGPVWWPGELQQYKDLQELVDGRKGTQVAKLPLEWAFHRDPHDTGLASGYAYRPADLRYWNTHAATQTLETRKDYPTDEWERVRTDLYPQAQGILHRDWQSYTGFMWYRTEVTLTAAEAKGKLRLRFPGIFNEAWLYVNGYLVAHRPSTGMWWQSDFTFSWDVALDGLLKAGVNSVTVRLDNPHHFGGLFRRPLLYRAR